MTHLTRDLHGLTVNQAKKVIADLIRYPKTSKITLIHGFKRGTALRNYIYCQMPADMRAIGLINRIVFFTNLSSNGRTTFGFARANISKSTNIGDFLDVDELMSVSGFPKIGADENESFDLEEK